MSSAIENTKIVEEENDKIDNKDIKIKCEAAMSSSKTQTEAASL